MGPLIRQHVLRAINSLPGPARKPVLELAIRAKRLIYNLPDAPPKQALSSKIGKAPKNGTPRILFIGPAAFNPGIWDTRVKYIFPDLIEPLAEKGAEIHMLTGVIPDHAMAGVELLNKDYGIVFRSTPEKQKGLLIAEHWAKHAINMAVEIQPDVVTNIFGAVDFGLGIGVAAKAVNAKAILRVAGDERAARTHLQTYKTERRAKYVELTETAGFNLADRIIVMSEQERQRVKKTLYRDGDNRVVICLRGINLTTFAPHPKRPTGRLRRRFCYVGRKSPEKGYDLIEEAAHIISKTEPDISFAFAGTFEPGRKGNVEYCGFLQAEALPGFFNDCDAFILCSRNEGFPQAVMEAMACGLPCILSKHIFEDVFVDGEEALLVDMDPGSVAEAVMRLSRDPALAERIATNARQIAVKRFDRKVQRQLYRRLILGSISKR